VRAILLLFFSLFAVTARADEIAPELLTLELRNKAIAEEKAVFATMSDADKRRLVGTYVAFDPSASDPIVMSACDDDGDYVVVISDAMLRLVDDVARAASYDEANGTHKLDEYAAFLLASQVQGRRVLPPPAGFHSGTRGTAEDDRLREALAFVIAHEVERMRNGDLVCPHPTATKEHGDDVWTADEQRRAAETARPIYPAHQSERDDDAAKRTTRPLDGAVAIARFFEGAPRFFTYAKLHPARTSVLRVGTKP
jgi:hypothetical protein